MNDRALPFRLSVTKPCSQRWEDLRGDSRERRCDLCDRNVQNLAHMTPREIEILVRRTPGRICAVLTRRDDGSLVTLESRPKASLAAGVIASAALALASAASAQATVGDSKLAVLTGTVLTPDGTRPLAAARITLEQAGSAIASTKSDEQGNFRIAAPPGHYEIRIRQSVLFGMHVSNANLHEGQQSLSRVRTHFDYVQSGGAVTFVGEVTATVHSPTSFAFKHPWLYLKQLVSRA